MLVDVICVDGTAVCGGDPFSMRVTREEDGPSSTGWTKVGSWKRAHPPCAVVLRGDRAGLGGGAVNVYQVDTCITSADYKTVGVVVDGDIAVSIAIEKI